MLLDLSLGIDQDVLEMVVRDKLILIISIPGKWPGPSQSRTPTVKVLEVWATFAHECMQQGGSLRSYGTEKNTGNQLKDSLKLGWHEK